MSDCVRFGTTNDTVTPGASSGFNGFTFPYQTSGTTGPGTSNPVGFTFQEIKRIWDRVKNWQFSSTCSMVVSGTTYTFSTQTLTPNSGNASTELDLIKNGTLRDFGGTDSLQFQITTPFINTDNTEFGTIYPDIIFSVVLSGGGSVVSFSLINTGTPDGSFTGQIDGVDMTVYYYFGSPPPDTFTPGNMILTPIEFWPYAGSAGGTNPGDPIYDTTDDSQLLPPTT